MQLKGSEVSARMTEISADQDACYSARNRGVEPN